MPAAWLQPASSSTTFQFIDSQFEQERTRAAIHSAFSNVRDITFTPMSLRAIFVAMAKIGRRAV
jgi:hypothetical protein